MHLPSSVQDAKGYFDKHKDRARPNEPKPTMQLGSPPKHLTDDQKKLWTEFKRKVLPGVAFDLAGVAVTGTLMIRFDVCMPVCAGRKAPG